MIDGNTCVPSSVAEAAPFIDDVLSDGRLYAFQSLIILPAAGRSLEPRVDAGSAK